MGEKFLSEEFSFKIFLILGTMYFRFYLVIIVQLWTN